MSGCALARAGLSLRMEDLEAVDNDWYKTLSIILSHPAEDVEDLSLTFAVGSHELVFGGMEIPVTGENRAP